MNFERLIVTDIGHCDKNFMPVSGPYKQRNRYCYALLFGKSGKIVYTMNGKDFTFDGRHALLLPAGSNYKYQIFEEGYVWVINFECENLDVSEITLLDIKDSEPYIQECERARELFLFPENRYGVFSCVYNILDRLKKENSNDNSILYPALLYLENNAFNPELSNQALARQANISEVYFRKLFFARFGKTPKQYILDIRIRKAKQLLKASNLSITQIAYSCGFSSPYNFSRTFKERTGITATKYAKNKNL